MGSYEMSSFRDAAMSSKAWPFEEARRLLKRYEKAPPEKGYVLFETAMAPLACPISAPLERSRAPRWCVAHSRRSRTSRPS